MKFICSHTVEPLYKPQEPYLFVPPIASNGRVNIFNKLSYRHLRGIFYIYKNQDFFDYPETFTIFQHRRYLVDPDLSDEYLVVLPYQTTVASTRAQWNCCHNDGIHLPKYLNILEDILGQEFSEYIDLSPNQYGFYHNIFTLRKLEFDAYCHFLFSVLFEAEKYIGLTTDVEHPVYAFLGERLGNFWLYKNIPYNKIKLVRMITVE